MPEAEFEIKNEDGSNPLVFKDGGLEEMAAPTVISNEKGELILPTGLNFGTYQLMKKSTERLSTKGRTLYF